MQEIKIGSSLVGENQPCYIIGEIGINHNGDIEIAKKLIDVAESIGCNAVKFQKRTVEVVYSAEDLAKYRETPFGQTNGDLKRRLEFGHSQYEKIDRYCRAESIDWFASCWDEASVDFIEHYHPPCYKIASASLTDDGLLLHTRQKAGTRPILLSTGMSSLEQIDHAVDVLGKDNLVLMHTTSTYPALATELNLRVIPALRLRYGLLVGYSGHETGVVTSAAAVALGACVVERHITLDRAMWGSDQAASLGPAGLAKMIQHIRYLEQAMGDGIKCVYPSEVLIQQKLRRK